jgi:3'-phosphoadenosine 5'-phosphosulfate sulfotransferase (PAPS reductase)/FAD synthetase
LLKLDRAPKVVESIKEIRPRSVVYLYSGGKDSSLALALTRDFIKSLCSDIGCKVYVVHIVVTGNSLPANTFCSQYVLKWHEQRYGFTPVVLGSSEELCRFDV